MPPNPKPRFLSLFALGVIIGGTTLGVGRLAWHAFSPTTPGNSAHPNTNPASAATSASSAVPDVFPSLIRLPPDEAEAALDAWLALDAPLDGTAPATLERQQLALRALLPLFSDTQFPRLLAALQHRTDDTASRLRQLVFDSWLQRNPAAVAQWIVAADFPDTDAVRHTLALQAGQFWAKLDATQALAWAESIADSGLSADVVEVILPNLAAVDPVKALALAEARGPEFFLKLRTALFTSWAKNDPVAALHRLGRDMLEANVHSEAVKDALATWLQKDLRGAIAWVDAEGVGGTNGKNNIMGGALIGAVYKLDQVNALADSVARLTDLPQRQSYLSSLLWHWHHKEPAIAVAWLKQMPSSEDRNQLIERLVPPQAYEGLVAPESYLPVTLQLPSGDARDTRLVSLLSAWAKEDPKAAFAWLDGQNDPSLAPITNQITGGLVAGLAQQDLPAALTRYQNLAPGAARTLAAPDIAYAWGDRDPAAAAQWLAKEFPGFPPNVNEMTLVRNSYASIGTYGEDGKFAVQERQAQIISILADNWSRKDPLSALRWAEAISDPLQRKIALTGITERGNGTWNRSVISPDPQKLADTLGQIQEPNTRQEYLALHLRQWLRNDVVAARAWLATSDLLPGDQIQQMLSETQNN